MNDLTSSSLERRKSDGMIRGIKITNYFHIAKEEIFRKQPRVPYLRERTDSTKEGEGGKMRLRGERNFWKNEYPPRRIARVEC